MPHENFIQAHRRNTAHHKTASSFRGFQRHSITPMTETEQKEIVGLFCLRFLILGKTERNP